MDAVLAQVARGVTLIGRQHGIYISAETACEDLAAGKVSTFHGLSEYFSVHNLTVTPRRLSLSDAEQRAYLFPLIATTRTGGAIIVVGPAPGDPALLQVLDPADPASGGRTMARDELADVWSGTVLLVARRTGETAKDRPFGWSWFSPELLRHKGLLLMVLGLSLVVHALAFTPIIFIQIALDKVLGYKATSTLYVLTAGVVLAVLFNGLLGYLRDRLMRHVAVTIEARLAADSFDKILDLPLRTLAANGESRLEQALSASTMVRTFLGGRLLPAVFDLTGVLIFLPVLFLYDPRLGGLVLLFGVLTGTASLVFKLLEKTHAARAGQLDQARAAVVRETFANIAAVKALSQEANQRKAFRVAAAEAIRANAERERISSLAGQVNTVLQQGMTIAIIFTGIWLVFGGAMTAGAIIAANMIGARVVTPITRAISLIAELDRVRATLQRLEETWNARPERRAAAGGQRSLLGGFTLTGVSVDYEGTSALQDVTLTIPPGQSVAVVGGSGAGKTTLVRLLQGLIRPSAGTIAIDGVALGAFDMQHYRRQVALVTARPSFFSGTIAENLKRVRPAVGEREILAALEETGFADLLPRLPEGQDTAIDASATALPAGYRQLLSLSRAVLAEPRVLLMDEAFSDVDKAHLLRLRERLATLKAGRTLLLVSLDLFFARAMDRIVVLDQGRVVGDGRHETLVETCPVYAEMWRVEQAYHASALPVRAAAATAGATA